METNGSYVALTLPFTCILVHGAASQPSVRAGPWLPAAAGSIILPTKMMGGRGVARRTARRTARRQGAIQEMCVYYAGISWGGSAEAPPR